MVEKAREGADRMLVAPFGGILGQFWIDAGHTAHVSRMEDVKRVLITLAESHVVEHYFEFLLVLIFTEPNAAEPECYRLSTTRLRENPWQQVKKFVCAL